VPLAQVLNQEYLGVQALIDKLRLDSEAALVAAENGKLFMQDEYEKVRVLKLPVHFPLSCVVKLNTIGPNLWCWCCLCRLLGSWAMRTSICGKRAPSRRSRYEVRA
jgi:hypothetical protein